MCPAYAADLGLYPAVIAACVALFPFVRYASTKAAFRCSAAALVVPRLTGALGLFRCGNCSRGLRFGISQSSFKIVICDKP